MNQKLFLPACLLLASFIAGCTPAAPPAPPDTRAADAQTIRDLETAWSQSFATRDVKKITAIYADDATLSISGMPLISGKANIVSTVSPFFNDKNFNLQFTTAKVVVAKSGDMAYSEGKYTQTMTDPKTKREVSESGKYVTVYMKQADGGWKAVSDIDNADGPDVPVKK